MVADALRVRSALDNGEFVPFFQPVVDLRSGCIKGFEVLARWNDPVSGIIPPDLFIPAAERDGWISDLTMELLRTAFRAVDDLPSPVRLSVNLSAGQLCDPALPSQIAAVAGAAGFSLDRLSLELTESALVRDMESARAIAHDLKALGCKLSLDDFGTGFSSLLSLQALPFDILKVDRSFVSSMTVNKESRKIVAMVVGLGQSLGIATVAEGIETEEQDQMLLWLGCDYGQGWNYGRPVPASALLDSYFSVRPRRKHEGLHPKRSLSMFDVPPATRLAQLRAIYDGAPVGLAFLDHEMRYVTLNKRLAEMNRVPVEAHLGNTLETMYPGLFQIIGTNIRQALAGESVVEMEVNTPLDGQFHGRSFLLSCEPARDEVGDVVGVSLAVADVTAVKQLERSRLEVQEHMRHMLDLNPQIQWVLDEHGGAVEVSREWNDTTGTGTESWRGWGWLDALHPDDAPKARENVLASIASRQPMDVKYRVRADGGDWVWKRARSWPRYDAEGNVPFWYGVLEDCEPDA
ncbi:sensor domain-containing phosphodiesterase [Granulicella pectinivorans]|nr:EAL domain-containing protein [Granulicella pectinivorans]